MKKRILMLLTALAVMFVPCTALATEPDDGMGTQPEDETPVVTDVSDVTVEESIVQNENKPFLALGKDLSEDQLNTVLGEMGILREDLDKYTVIYITNEMEHQYLDSYIDPSVIGSYALSCVMVKENNEGTGIRVTTKNINYCTVNMYKNALLTAGIENADVLVVGPFPISGTAALIGAWNAYEEMTGEELEEERKTAALAEMITIGDLTEGVSEEESEKIEDLIEFVKADVIANKLTDIEDIKDAIKNAQDEYNITLSEDQIAALVGIMTKISDLDIDPKKLLEQAGDLYNKYGDTVLSEAKDAINGIFTEEVKASLWENIKAIIKTLFKAIADFFSSK